MESHQTVEIVRRSLGRFGSALAYADFRTMWLANMSAQSASWALIVSRGWLVFDMTHSSMAVGIVTFAAMAPQVFIPPFAGVLADRMDRRTLLGSTYATNLAVNLMLAALAWMGGIEEWHIAALAVVNGAARATQLTTSQALAANLVPPERLLNALSLTAATNHMSRLVGPGLATPLLALVGAHAAFLLCSSLYGLGWWQITRIATESRGGVRKGETFLHSFSAGIAYVRSQPFIRMVIVMVMFHCALTMAFESLLPNFAHQALDAHTTGFGTLMMGVGVGSLVGSLFVGGIESTIARGRLYLILGTLSGVGQMLLSVSPNMPLAIMAAAVMGASQSGFMTMGQSITQSLAADQYRGRVASINALSFGGLMAIMNLANGFLGHGLGAGAILFANGSVFVLVMLASIAFTTPRGVYMEGVPVRIAARAGAA